MCTYNSESIRQNDRIINPLCRSKHFFLWKYEESILVSLIMNFSYKNIHESNYASDNKPFQLMNVKHQPLQIES